MSSIPSPPLSYHSPTHSPAGTLVRSKPGGGRPRRLRIANPDDSDQPEGTLSSFHPQRSQTSPSTTSSVGSSISASAIAPGMHAPVRGHTMAASSSSSSNSTGLVGSGNGNGFSKREEEGGGEISPASPSGGSAGLYVDSPPQTFSDGHTVLSAPSSFSPSAPPKPTHQTSLHIEAPVIPPFSPISPISGLPTPSPPVPPPKEHVLPPIPQPGQSFSSSPIETHHRHPFSSAPPPPPYVQNPSVSPASPTSSSSPSSLLPPTHLSVSSRDHHSPRIPSRRSSTDRTATPGITTHDDLDGLIKEVDQMVLDANIHPPIPGVKLLVTGDAGNFRMVDIGGCTNSAAIRDKVFSALEVRDDLHSSFSLFKHDLGAPSSSTTSTASSSASLDGENLYTFCADPSSTIKSILVVQTSVDPEHDSESFIPPPPAVSPLGQYPPLRPKTRKGNGSISSLSEHDPALGGGSGYDASIPDSESETGGAVSTTGSGSSTLQRRKARGASGSSPHPRTIRLASAPSISNTTKESDLTTSPTSSVGSLSSRGATNGGANARRSYSSVMPTPPNHYPSTAATSADEAASRPVSGASLEGIAELASASTPGAENAEEAEAEYLRKLKEEYEKKDREEEEARKQQQIRDDHEAAVREQKKEEEIWKAEQEEVAAQNTLMMQSARDRERERLERQQSTASIHQTHNPLPQPPLHPVSHENDMSQWGIPSDSSTLIATARTLPTPRSTQSWSPDPNRALSPEQFINSVQGGSFHYSQYPSNFQPGYNSTSVATHHPSYQQPPPLPLQPRRNGGQPPVRPRIQVDTNNFNNNSLRSYPHHQYPGQNLMAPSPSSANSPSVYGQPQLQGTVRRPSQNSLPPPIGISGPNGGARPIHNMRSESNLNMRQQPYYNTIPPSPVNSIPASPYQTQPPFFSYPVSQQSQQQQQRAHWDRRPSAGRAPSPTYQYEQSPPIVQGSPALNGTFSPQQQFQQYSEPRARYGSSGEISPRPNTMHETSTTQQRSAPYLGVERRPSTVYDSTPSHDLRNTSFLPINPTAAPPSSQSSLNQTGPYPTIHHRHINSDSEIPAAPAVPRRSSNDMDTRGRKTSLPSSNLSRSSSAAHGGSSSHVADMNDAYDGMTDEELPVRPDPVSLASLDTSSLSMSSVPDHDPDGTLFIVPRKKSAPTTPGAPPSVSSDTSTTKPFGDLGSGDELEDSTLRGWAGGSDDLNDDDDGGSTLQGHGTATLPARMDNKSLPPIKTERPVLSALRSGESSNSPLPASSSDDASGSASTQNIPEIENKVLSRARRGREASSGGLNRVKSVFEKDVDKQWAFRPPPEVVIKNMDKFFPGINLEAEVLEAGTPTPVSSASSVAPVTSTSKLNKRKSIRRVAEDRQKSVEKTKGKGAFSSVPGVDRLMHGLKRTSTKMWGSIVEEVTPGDIASKVPVSVQEVDDEEEEDRPKTFKWVKGDLIGKGAYGRVYLGLNATTGDMIAVKQVEMPTTLSDRADERQTLTIDALKSEIELLKDLDHPYIVQYLGFEQTPDFISIFLEYVPGGSLGSVFKKHGKLEEGGVRHFSRQILEGLAYLHSKNILHRDLKGDNILIDPHVEGAVCKITDFGISKQSGADAYEVDNATMLQGSVFWMAPEVINNSLKGYSAKVDIWSFGCVVLEMFCGERPWAGEEMMAIMFKLGSGNRPPIPNHIILSDSASDFLTNKCFAIAERDRPTAAQLLQHDFLIPDPTWRWETSSLAAKVNQNVSSRSRIVGNRLRSG